jgi:hypothetical protein
LESQPIAEEAQLASEVVDVKPADTSATETQAEEGSENKSMLDVVKAALQRPDKSPKSENGQEQDADPAQPKKDDSGSEDLPAEEMKLLSKKAQTRFSSLANAKRDLETQVKGLSEKAEGFDRVAAIIDRNQLSPEDVNTGFEIMGLLKLDPQKALEKLSPIVKTLLAHVGYELPDDLKSEVDLGAITQERARELAAARMRESRNEGQRVQREQDEQSRQLRETSTKMTGVADAWVAERKTSDPDWHLKQNRVTDLVKIHLLETKKLPQTEKEARDLFAAKLKLVEDEMKGLLPKAKAIVPARGDASSAATPTATSILDIVRMGGGKGKA